MSNLQFRWLGQVSTCLDGELVQPDRPSRKADVLLAYLAMNDNIVHERSKLIDLLCFKVKDPATDFRGVLKFAREMAGQHITPQFYAISNVKGASAVRFEPAAGLHILHIDAVEFRRPLSGTVTIADLMHKATLYQGPFMPGYEDLDSMGWVEQMRAGLDSQFGALMKRLLDELFAAERWTDLAKWAEHWIAHSDVPQAAYSDLIAAYSELGDLPRLDATYARYAQALAKLGVEPSEELHRQYVYWRKALTERYSKPMESEREIASKTPSKTQQAQPQQPVPKPLPPQHTTFIGRANDLANIAAKLTDPECRLLTLVGIGGVGKTRLAVHIAQDLAQHFPDGVCFVNFSQIDSDDLLLAALADALNFVPYGQEPLQTQLHNFLHAKRLLLVLDSFEHAFATWTGAIESTQILEDVLAAAPEVKALVTSRERLRLASEHILAVAGLDYPGEATLMTNMLSAAETPIENFGAVQLFLRTARRVRKEFSLHDEREGVVRICQRAEGLPLAIDLAAVHVAGMSASDIADAIEASLDVLAAQGAFSPDDDPRHRSVRATFEYSWRMMTAEEQRAFAQLSAFAGSFSREAAQTVVNTPQRVLSGLVSNALLGYDFKAGRYDMHDLLRQFAAEKLQAEEGLRDATLFTRLSDYYLSFARRNQKRYAELEREWANFLAAMRLAHAGARWQTVMEFAEVLGEAWFTRARFSDARVGCTLAVAAARAADLPEPLAAFLRRHAQACIEQASYNEASGYLDEALRLSYEVEDESLTAGVLCDQGKVALEFGKDAEAENLLLKSQQIYEQFENKAGVAEVLELRGRVQNRLGNNELAVIHIRESINLSREIGIKRSLISNLTELAVIESESQNHHSAKLLAAESLKLCEELRDPNMLADSLYVSAQVKWRAGQLQSAKTDALAGSELMQLMGARKAQAHVFLLIGKIENTLANLHEAMCYAQRSLAIYRQLEDPSAVIYALQFLGFVYNQLGKNSQACETWLEGLAIAERFKHRLWQQLHDLINSQCNG